MENWKKAVINAGIMGGITFCSTVASAGGEVTLQNVTSAGIAFGITFFTLCSKYFRPPEDDCNEDDEKPEETEKKPSIGSIIGCLWV